MGSVIVGIGGVGKTVLMKLRRMIVEEHGKLSLDIYGSTGTGVVN